jgi:predicted RNase H-like nuclease
MAMKKLTSKQPSDLPVRVCNETVGDSDTILMGVDLAWLSDKNGSGLAVGQLSGNTLSVSDVYTAVIGYQNVVTIIDSVPGLAGLAIDAPLIIKNTSGNRPCEKALNAVYAKKWAGCHPSNLGLYPEASSVNLGADLLKKQFQHLGRPGHEKWQFECYPHPSMVELFALEKRLAYKKGKVEEKRAGQKQLARLIQSLKGRSLSLTINPELNYLLDEARIGVLRGQALKDNEDALDAIICLYIAGLYASGAPMQTFGDIESGYVVVPRADNLA